MKSYFLFLLIIVNFSGFKLELVEVGINNDFNGTDLNPTCPAYNVLLYTIRRQCPAIKDLRCVYKLPSDIVIPGTLNFDAFEKPMLMRHLTSMQFLNLVNTKDSYGRPWCMLTFLYSPDCVFSAKVARLIYQVAPYFDKLHVVAVNLSLYNEGVDEIISTFGIASTPVIGLWENGMPKYRFYESYRTVYDLINVIESRTDLRRKNPEPELIEKTSLGDDEKFYIIGVNRIQSTWWIPWSKPVDFPHKEYMSEEEFLSYFRFLSGDIGFDWYFVLALFTLFMNISCFLWLSPKAREFVQRWFHLSFSRQTPIIQ